MLALASQLAETEHQTLPACGARPSVPRPLLPHRLPMKTAFLCRALAATLLLSACGARPEAAPSFEYLVVGSGGGADEGAVTTYRLDRATGDLTEADRKTVGRTVSFVAINPNLPVLYATDERGAAVHWLRLDSTTGMLEPVGQREANGNPVYLDVDATGSTLLAVNYGAGTVDAFPLDPETGAPGTPVNYETGRNSHAAIFHPNNAYVYVAAVAENYIAQYAYDGGTLTPLSPATVTLEGGIRHIYMHPSGDYVYGVAGPTDNVAAFRVAGDGTLSLVSTARRLAPEHSAEAGTHMGSDIHVTPDGRFAYAASRGASNTIAVYTIGDDGGLTLVQLQSTEGSTPRNFGLDPSGEILAVGNQESRTVAIFRIDPDSGALTHLHTEEVGVTPWFVGIWRVTE